MTNIRVQGQDTVRVGTIFCIGRNYAAHAAELGNAVPKEPVVFLKPATAVLQATLDEVGQIMLPSYSNCVHYECEMVVLIGKNARPAAYAVGLDLTARDVQEHVKQNGLPWTAAKGFKTSACLSEFVPADVAGDFGGQHFQLFVNGLLKQDGHTTDMLFSLPVLLAHLDERYGLSEGDLIFTGTPPGVGALSGADELHLSWQGIRAVFAVQAAV